MVRCSPLRRSTNETASSANILARWVERQYRYRLKQECSHSSITEAAPNIIFFAIQLGNQTSAVRLISYDRRCCGGSFAATPRSFELAAARRAQKSEIGHATVDRRAPTLSGQYVASCRRVCCLCVLRRGLVVLRRGLVAIWIKDCQRHSSQRQRHDRSAKSLPFGSTNGQ
jgi:hypothetical protein